MSEHAIKVAVIGVGYLGKFHAQKYAQLPQTELVAVVDIDPLVAQEVANACHCQALTDYQDLLGQVAAVSIAVPTVHHFAIARDFLACQTHVLLEKPMTTTLAEAQILNSLAKEQGVVLQIGHLERFNAAFLDLESMPLAPRFIESHRLAPFKPRATDVNVVLDLMIHDIDIILDMVDAPVSSVAASGAAVLSQEIDIANARLEFENGCVANVTSSRVSMKTERKMRIFQPEAYISIDFQHRGLSIHRLGEQEMFPGVPEIVSEQSFFAQSDALLAEITAFVQAILQQGPVIVSGIDAARALATAIHITELVRDSAPLGRR